MEIEELFDELEDLSDSGPEVDTMSVSSTPKPSLRPFFSSSRSLLAPPNAGKYKDCLKNHDRKASAKNCTTAKSQTLATR